MRAVCAWMNDSYCWVCSCAFQCVVSVWLARKGSSILWQHLGLGTDGSVGFTGPLSVLCGCGESVLFESWLSILCDSGGISWRRSDAS